MFASTDNELGHDLNDDFTNQIIGQQVYSSGAAPPSLKNDHSPNNLKKKLQERLQRNGTYTSSVNSYSLPNSNMISPNQQSFNAAQLSNSLPNQQYYQSNPQEVSKPKYATQTSYMSPRMATIQTPQSPITNTASNQYNPHYNALNSNSMPHVLTKQSAENNAQIANQNQTVKYYVFRFYEIRN